MMRNSAEIWQLTACLCWQMLDRAEDSAHSLLHPGCEAAAHPMEPPSTTPAALRILTMAQAMAAVHALPARPMTARSGAPNCQI
jgi:hypothetical protein